jgi:hypothetical protein
LFQRTAKTHKAAIGEDTSINKFKRFIELCSEVTSESEIDEASFYFDQILDYIKDGNDLPQDKKTVARVLGL